MRIEELFKDKSIKPKDKVTTISKWLLDESLPYDELIAFASVSKDPVKASCIEALEYVTKQQPAMVNKEVFDFVTTTLNEKAPRIKWESAKVIGNIASLFPKKLDETITGLLKNASHDGTVVRWSAAFAIGEIIKLNTVLNVNLIPLAEQIISKEEKNSIKKIYSDAIKKIKCSPKEIS